MWYKLLIFSINLVNSKWFDLGQLKIRYILGPMEYLWFYIWHIYIVCYNSIKRKGILPPYSKIKSFWTRLGSNIGNINHEYLLNCWVWKCESHIKRFVLKNTFIKNIHISLFDKYFLYNKKSKLYFEDRVAVQNNFIF